MSVSKQVVGIVASCACASALAKVTIYTDVLTFEQALASVKVETFNGNVLHDPGLSVVSWNGLIVGGQFVDTVATGYVNTVPDQQDSSAARVVLRGRGYA